MKKGGMKSMYKEDINALKLFNEKAEKLKNLSFTKTVLIEQQSTGRE